MDVSTIVGNTATSTNQSSSNKPVTNSQSSEKKFLEYMEKTPEEFMFEAFLERHDLTKEEFQKLSPEDQESLLKEFKEEMRAKAGLKGTI